MEPHLRSGTSGWLDSGESQRCTERTGALFGICQAVHGPRGTYCCQCWSSCAGNGDDEKDLTAGTLNGEIRKSQAAALLK